MVDWLENDPSNRPSDMGVWGMEKSSYNFKDLGAYIQQAEGKGKRKKAKVVDKDAGQKKNNDDHKKTKKQVK